jgi:hypothetical protein
LGGDESEQMARTILGVDSMMHPHELANVLGFDSIYKKYAARAAQKVVKFKYGEMAFNGRDDASIWEKKKELPPNIEL